MDHISELVYDPGFMIGWFANAIEAGYDQGWKEAKERKNVFEDREDGPELVDWSKQFDELHYKEKDG